MGDPFVAMTSQEAANECNNYAPQTVKCGSCKAKVIIHCESCKIQITGCFDTDVARFGREEAERRLKVRSAATTGGIHG